MFIISSQNLFRCLTYKAFVLLDIQNVTHVLKAAGGKLAVVLLELVGGLREHQEPAFATGDLQASTVRTLIMIPQNI